MTKKVIKKRGMPAYKATQEDRDNCRLWSGMGMTQENIARKLKISVDTLHKYLDDEYQDGKSDSNFSIAGSLYKNAIGGNVVAQMFWLKTQARWAETEKIELTGKDGGPVEISEAKARMLASVAALEAKEKNKTVEE